MNDDNEALLGPTGHLGIGNRARIRRTANEAKALVWPEIKRGHLINAAALIGSWAMCHRGANAFKEIETILKSREKEQ